MVADAADGADNIFPSARILINLLPARTRLNIMSMPGARWNVCARRGRSSEPQAPYAAFRSLYGLIRSSGGIFHALWIR
jgi:hypothetical protein